VRQGEASLAISRLAGAGVLNAGPYTLPLPTPLRQRLFLHIATEPPGLRPLINQEELIEGDGARSHSDDRGGTDPSFHSHASRCGVEPASNRMHSTR
jgi:hypothetical protein